jgi:DNA-binding CsgD family transcriptional regulator
MKTEPSLPVCYEEYLNLCSSLSLQNKRLNIEDYRLLDPPGNYPHLPFGYGLIDYTTQNYLFISSNIDEILGFNKQDYLKGIGFHYNKIVPQDRIVFGQKIFPDILRFLFKLPKDDYEKYRFAYTYRSYKYDGCISNLLQQCTFLEPDIYGRPLVNKFVISDISYLVTGEWMSLTIFYLEKDKGFIPVFKKKYNTKLSHQISSRELEILNLSFKGLSSKLIADKLFLSIHTVKNHKRNMMEKTASRNISELINFAIRNKLIF